MDSFRPARHSETAAEGQAAIPETSFEALPESDASDEPIHDAEPSGPLRDSAPTVVNPDLTETKTIQGVRPGDRYVRRTDPYRRYFKRVGPGHYVATQEATHSPSAFAHFYRVVKAVLIGRPLESAAESQERLSKFKALAVFSSDAISSVAYATGEIMFVLVVAGSAALNLAIPISLAIAVLLSIVAFSYRQTIFAYPNGGGSYIVSRENIGTVAGLIAAAALLIDYILTVAVSISAGTDAVTSAFPVLRPFNVELALFFVLLMTLINLRGVRESGSVFAVPTYAFILTLGGMIVLGIVGIMLGWYQPPANLTPLPVREPLTLFLVLTAFSAGAVSYERYRSHFQWCALLQKAAQQECS